MGVAGKTLVITSAIIFAFLVGILTYLNSQDIPEDELIRRCQTSHPEWLSYQEDVKGQVGAAPVAAWKGEPIEAVLAANGRLFITFSLASPWAEYAAALPVLVRDPLGHVYQDESAERKNGARVYAFSLAEVQDPAQIPWIELRYPHTERRIPLDGAGLWRKP